VSPSPPGWTSCGRYPGSDGRICGQHTEPEISCALDTCRRLQRGRSVGIRQISPGTRIPRPRYMEGAVTVNSRIPGFKDSSVEQRRSVVSERTGVAVADLDVLDPARGLDTEHADHMIENVIGVLGIPV